MGDWEEVPVPRCDDGRIWALGVGHLEQSLSFIDGGIGGSLGKEVWCKISCIRSTNTLYPDVRDSKLHGLCEDGPNRDSLTRLAFGSLRFRAYVTNKVARFCTTTRIDEDCCRTTGGIPILKIIAIEKVPGFQ